MKKYLYLAYDLACIVGALLLALYLRHGFPLIQEGKPEDLSLLLMVTIGTAAFILPLMRTHTGMWRFTSGTELANIMLAVALIIVVCNSTLFLISRLEMMPRSVPPMHWAIAVVAMGGSRLLARRLLRTHALHPSQTQVKQHVIVVGACHTAELYLQFIKRIIQHEVVVVGLVDNDHALTNRLFQKHKILGTPEHLPHLIEEFHVHGIYIKQIVLAHLLDDLPPEQQQLLQQLADTNAIDLVHFGKQMRPQTTDTPAKAHSDYYQALGVLSQTSYVNPRGVYPYLKRAFDLIAGTCLCIVLLPLMMATTLLVAVDVGFPLLFWQQRPGLRGAPFHLYKFRTMRHARRKLNEDRLSHKSGDTARTSILGKWLRRLRLDELPQLFHIIFGTMSFVGPRPLLPDDQPANGQQRLSVRPGVTGWAQIHGGDALTPEEKLVLDLWYIRHMSFWLDMRILLRTLTVVLKEDRRVKVIITPNHYSVKP